MRVAVVYHFFAHYRAPVMTALIEHPEVEYYLIGDREDPDGSIKAWLPPSERFLPVKSKKLFRGMLWQTGLLSALQRLDPSVVIFLGDAHFVSTWIAAAICRIRGRRVLFWTHGWTRRDSGYKRWVRVLFYRLANGLLLYGNRARDIGEENGFKRHSMHVIFNSLDYTEQKRIRETIDWRSIESMRDSLSCFGGMPQVAFVGRLVSTCRLSDLVLALACLKDRGVNANAVLIGDGPDRDNLQNLAAKHKIPVRFLGECYDELTIGRIIMASHVLVSPGKIGLMSMHSMAYGTPVITHGDVDRQMPEVEAIVPGVTGDFFCYGSVEELANALEPWLKRQWPDPRVREACIAAIERAYTPHRQVELIGRAVHGERAL